MCGSKSKCRRYPVTRRIANSTSHSASFLESLGKMTWRFDLRTSSRREARAPAGIRADFSVDQAARIAILLKAGGEGERFRDRFVQLCRTADIAEQVAFYRGLPLYPNPELLIHQAGEAARTNMRSVFEALAHRNPFPFEQFDQNRWNHMVLKALFIGSQLHPIQGLGQRANAELAVILRDYAHERWAAGRNVTPRTLALRGRRARHRPGAGGS